MRVMSRIGSVMLGVLCALAGVVALGYALDGIETLKFFRGNLLGGIVGTLVPGVLCASAFYMAVRLIKNQPRK
jgi:ammonia channel protein AmtB